MSAFIGPGLLKGIECWFFGGSGICILIEGLVVLIDILEVVMTTFSGTVAQGRLDLGDVAFKGGGLWEFRGVMTALAERGSFLWG
jgi:hypothetical protein